MNGEQLKKSILQYAIQGKLVEKNLHDEPASVLLKKIKEVKEQLIKEKVIKKDKNESFIYRKDGSFYEKVGKTEKCIDDELPFDIPDNWEWVRLSNIINFSIGKTPKRVESQYWNKGKYNWISISDIIDGGVTYETKEKVTQKAYEEVFRGKISPKGTLIMSFKLSIGKVSILGNDSFHNEAIVSIYPILDKDEILKKYLLNILPTISLNGNSKKAIKGSTLNSNSIKNLLIPLPNFSEQQKIVDKIEKLLLLVKEYGEASESLDKLNSQLPILIEKSTLKYAFEGKLVE